MVRRALVVGASGGLGAALVQALEARGAEVHGLSRSVDGLELTDPRSVETVMTRQQGPFDLVLVATGVLAPPGGAPEKSLARIEAAAMAELFAINAIGPALILRHLPRLLDRRAPSVAGVLTARVGSIGDNALGGWHGYRASKAAANQIVRGASIEIARSHPRAAVVALHPGTVETRFTADYPGHRKVPAETAARNLLDVIEGLGAADTGRFLDWAGKEIPW